MSPETAIVVILLLVASIKLEAKPPKDDAVVHSACGGNIVSIGSIIRYPSTAKYASGKDCTWRIQIGQPFLLKFSRFDVEGSSVCAYDYVQIAGRKRWCGSSIPPSTYSNGTMNLIFHSDSGFGKAGFQAEITPFSGPCELCQCIKKKVDCRSHHLTHVPRDIPSNIVTLDLRKNQIKSLPYTVFNRFADLETLHLYGNQITRLDEEVFSHLTKLKELSLFNNRITSLPNGVFSRLTNLDTLFLSNNRISSLPSKVFSSLTKLKDLSLFRNKIRSLPNDVFSQLSNVESLSLDKNQITDLPNGVFSRLTKLEDLYLSNNRITTLQSGAFSMLANLTSLWLGNNQINSLPSGVFNHLVNLEILSLPSNGITNLPIGVLTGLTNLHTLYLDNNPLICSCDLYKILKKVKNVRGTCNGSIDLKSATREQLCSMK